MAYTRTNTRTPTPARSCSLKDMTAVVPEAGDSPPPPYSEGPADKCTAAALPSPKGGVVVVNQLPRYEELKPLADGFFIWRDVQIVRVLVV